MTTANPPHNEPDQRTNLAEKVRARRLYLGLSVRSAAEKADVMAYLISLKR